MGVDLLRMYTSFPVIEVCILSILIGGYFLPFDRLPVLVHVRDGGKPDQLLETFLEILYVLVRILQDRNILSSVPASVGCMCILSALVKRCQPQVDSPSTNRSMLARVLFSYSPAPSETCHLKHSPLSKDLIYIDGTRIVLSAMQVGWSLPITRARGEQMILDTRGKGVGDEAKETGL